MKPQRFDNVPACDKQLTLLCPHCGENYTHHEGIEVYQRCHEDYRTGIHLVIDNMSVKMDTDAETNNPSGRRNGLIIRFYCECCQGLFGLSVRQHKGQTFFKMVDLGYKVDLSLIS